MSIPSECTVLVVGGGPAGSYAASVLAREGVNTVVLEADVFPRYHVGESMLASIRHFLRFIDLDETFDKYGFNVKKGAAFKLNEKPPGYTDFVAAGGPNGYAWNVVRSEADDLMFRHAGKSGAKIFDGVKVNTIDFLPLDSTTQGSEGSDLGRPVSAAWSKKDGSSGTINFEYIVDASGRAGIVSTKYLKNRRYNQGLKNVASWGYWKGASPYGVGTPKEGQPYFEALEDASGWVWSIPLHNGTTSVGVVMNQELSTKKKRAMGSPSGQEFYMESLKLVPGITALLSKAEFVSDLKSGSDWSYSASTYSSPYVRIAGDAGSFIDPFFSSGVHLALASGLSAATTIRASMKRDCDEEAAAKWHSDKVAEGYTRFLLVVLSVLKQIRQRDEPVLSDWDENGFDKAFALFRPIIQGANATNGELTQEEISKTVDFCFHAFEPAAREEREALARKMETINGTDDATVKASDEELQKALSPDELRILNTMRAREMIRQEDIVNLENFNTDPINGMVPNMKRGDLGLVMAKTTIEAKARGGDAFALMFGEDKLGQVAIAAH